MAMSNTARINACSLSSHAGSSRSLRISFTSDSNSRRFFMSVAHEERGHYLTLMDMHNYLTLPEDWFYVTQMSNVDGA